MSNADILDTRFGSGLRRMAERGPEARGHEYVRAGHHGVIAKLGIDGAVPRAGAVCALRLRPDHGRSGKFLPRCGRNSGAARSLN
jgi:hypothetical protein